MYTYMYLSTYKYVYTYMLRGGGGGDQDLPAISRIPLSLLPRFSLPLAFPLAIDGQ